MSEEGQLEIQNGQKKTIVPKDLSKFTFNFSSGSSDDDQSSEISKRGNSIKIQRLKMVKHESEEKISYSQTKFSHKDDEDF